MPRRDLLPGKYTADSAGGTIITFFPRTGPIVSDSRDYNIIRLSSVYVYEIIYGTPNSIEPIEELVKNVPQNVNQNNDPHARQVARKYRVRDRSS